MKSRLFLKRKTVDCINTFFVASIAILGFSLLSSCKQSKDEDILTDKDLLTAADNAATAARYTLTNGN